MRTWITIIVVCGVIAVGTTVAYRFLRPEWVSCRSGDSSFAVKQYVAAARSYQEALGKGLEAPPVYLRLTESLLVLGRMQEARETARLFSTGTTHTPATLYTLSELFVAHGDFDFSVQLLNRLVAGNPTSRKARFRLAQVLTWTRHFDPAIEHFQLLLGGKP